jgi:indole-3-glycerol phosphate synthase
MPNMLDEIVANKKEEIEQMKAALPLDQLREWAFPAQGRFLKAFKIPAIHLITEIKPKSPSAGVMREKLDLQSILRVYGKYATAISVLTDHKFFNGSFELLRQVSETSDLPLLCKDFVLDPYQCFRARAAGAEAVLLIAKIVDDSTLKVLHDTILALNMCPVVEVQNAQEVKRALVLSPKVILINNRNLQNFDVDLNTTEKIMKTIPADVLAISASGIEGKKDIEKLRAHCSNFLVGSSLMRAENLEDKLKELKSVEMVRRKKQINISAISPARG